MSTGAEKSNQVRPEDQSGGNVSGKAPHAVLFQPPAFMGQSGQADNRETDRGPGGK